jgi:radical SAM protein with 4Fe4S-binding SPASM domain
VFTVTTYDERHCHKWALLLKQRREKLGKLLDSVAKEDYENARRLFQEIFYGVSGKQADPGMFGSLLYHLAMVTKMETETKVLTEELGLSVPEIDEKLQRFFGEFVSDATELTKSSAPLSINAEEIAAKKNLTTKQKISLFTELNQRTRTVAKMLENKSPTSPTSLQNLFQKWAKHVAETRMRQEYETIKGLLTLADFSKTIGVPRLKAAMENVQEKFGEETVNIALSVTLKVGLRREKLQSIMLSDHYINYKMNMETLDGDMEFLNCPIYGGHKYIGNELGIDENVASLFCKHFCFAHAKAMLETVLPFPFGFAQPKRMATDGKCDFHLKLGYSPNASNTEKYVPLVLSWNVTRKCNLKCSHCYINAAPREYTDELTTEEGKRLIDQICEVSHPLLILSGGEPLLRTDIYELIEYGTRKGLRMGLGSNGTLIDDSVAKKLKQSGIKTVSISLDSHIPDHHDDFRGVRGSWQKAINAIKALRENDVLVQVNTTLTQQNYDEIDDIMSMVEQLGVENFHLFFLVPTGRGKKIADITPTMYEDMIRNTFAKTVRHKLNVKPSCAPQFMRIAKDMNLDMRQWVRGCMAGMYYCRVYPNGEITPCPYLPIKLGNVREKSFKDIWFGSKVFKKIRDFNSLEGKCGLCEYRSICGGCRARAYGLSTDFVDYCGDLHEPAELKGDYMKEDPWCVFHPKKET